MIYITGDIHGNPIGLSKAPFPEQKEMTREDYVIILGDFGIIWDREESKTEMYWLKWLENKNYTTLFIDGNHENHKRLNEFSVEKWNGGLVHKIRPHVIHLMRGQVFDINNKKFFTFGGASSHDISDGILDYNDKDWKTKARRLDQQGKCMYRIKDLSWWEEEMPSDSEMNIGMKNLENNNNTVDFVLSHCAPSSTAALISSGTYKPDILTKYLEDIRANIEYKKWFCGHYHIDRAINDKDIVLYEQIIRIQ